MIYFTNQDEEVPVNISEPTILKKLIGIPQTGRGIIEEDKEANQNDILESALQILNEINTDSDREVMTKVYLTDLKYSSRIPDI